ncbi:hypothetical protein FHS19_005429 [Paenibacillus rhizosphaerae]|uniref:Uncharacterized protein n=1 Tax=Paenibacillus rhizosphaerae TaxID=297318 RepID=A0A839TYS5_9BACL|nr:hypothetical protein [Paenibacillus rhizosphaerae]MBB3130710.1 hypothetical protein [Paenibacillus rhizosphaerae]
MRSEIDRLLATVRLISGGVKSQFERVSPGIIVSGMLLIVPLLFTYGLVTVGLFWGDKKGKYGDWGVVKNPKIILAYLKGTDRLSTRTKRTTKSSGNVPSGSSGDFYHKYIFLGHTKRTPMN